MIIPRDYQQLEIVDPLVDYLVTEPVGNPICAAPTGVGKSLSINMFIKQSIESDPDLRIMVAAHVREIVGQNAQSMLDFWKDAPIGVFSAGLKQYNTTARILYAGIQSIYNKSEQFGWLDAIVCDEAHTLSDREASMWQKFIRGCRKINPDIRVIGFTATPFKLGVGLLTELELFDKIVVDLTTTERINKFVDDGYLCPLVSKKPSMEIDITNVSMKGGDFDEHDLAIVTDTDELNRAVVKECIRFGVDRKHWLVYATGKTHAEHLKQRFLANGITCEILLGDASDEERTRLIGDKGRKITGEFQQGKFRALINVGVLTTGFDMPMLDLIALARATQSTGLYVQVLGRGTRPYPGKTNCLILDFGQNIVRLGAFNAPIIPKPRRKGDSAGGEAPVKACKECGSYCHTRIMICPDCGAEFPAGSNIEKTASQAKVMIESSVTPQYEILQVLSTHYSDQNAKDPSWGRLVKISYGDLTKSVSEYHFPSAPLEWKRREFAKLWVTAGGQLPVPHDSENFLERARKELKSPVRVTYTSNKKYPDVVKREYA